MLSDLVDNLVGVPVHIVCQEFQTVPRTPELSANDNKELKFPSTLLIMSGFLSVSNHSSLKGFSLTSPKKVKIANGFTFSVLDA